MPPSTCTPIYSKPMRWGLHPSPGYYKHPPLAGLAAGVWFLVFPATDWSFHLFAMCNSALALYATYLIARRYLDGDKRIVAVLLLLLTPFYQFHGQRFSTNQTLISTWPIATYCFLRAFETFEQADKRPCVGRSCRRDGRTCGARQILFGISAGRVSCGGARSPARPRLSAIMVALAVGGGRRRRAGPARALAVYQRLRVLSTMRSRCMLAPPWRRRCRRTGVISQAASLMSSVLLVGLLAGDVARSRARRERSYGRPIRTGECWSRCSPCRSFCPPSSPLSSARC